jgi:diguanylate cyclase (GGDEF)-like protein
MGTVSPQPNEPYEEHVLARAYRTLLGSEDFDELFREVAEAARSYTNCDEVVISAVDPNGLSVATVGPWTSGSITGSPSDPLARPSLPMPVVSDGHTTHLMTFYKGEPKERFTPADVDHARRWSELAGLVVSGAALVGGFAGQSGIDDETGVLIRRGFEDDVMDALSANDGRAGLFIVRVADLEQINNRWGREVGDEVLRLVARAMREAIGAAGTVGRLRRHEFGGLLPGLDLARTAEFAAATQRALTNPLPVLGLPDVSAAVVVGMAAAQGGRPNSVAPLLHATYQSLESAAADRHSDPRASAFGL